MARGSLFFLHRCLWRAWRRRRSICRPANGTDRASQSMRKLAGVWQGWRHSEAVFGRLGRRRLAWRGWFSVNGRRFGLARPPCWRRSGGIAASWGRRRRWYTWAVCWRGRRRRKPISWFDAVGMGSCWWRRRGRRNVASCSSHQLLLLLLQEVDDELLILLNELIGQALVSQILSKVLAPIRVERIENREFGGLVTVGSPERWHSAMCSWRIGGCGS